MPPRKYPKLPGEDGSAVRRVRKGYVPIADLRRAINDTPSLFERALLKTIYYCGLRASEPGLQPISHFDPERGTLDIIRLKGSLPHTYQLEPWVLDDLRLWVKRRPKSEYLFPHPRDPKFPLDRFNVRHIWIRAATRAKLDLKTLGHPHVLKHSLATHMLERGDDILFVQEWLGHKKLESTQVYAELTGKRLQAGQHVVSNLMKELEEP